MITLTLLLFTVLALAAHAAPLPPSSPDEAWNSGEFSDLYFEHRLDSIQRNEWIMFGLLVLFGLIGFGVVCFMTIKYAAGLWRGISLNHDELIEILEEFKTLQVQDVDDGAEANYDRVMTWLDHDRTKQTSPADSSAPSSEAAPPAPLVSPANTTAEVHLDLSEASPPPIECPPLDFAVLDFGYDEDDFSPDTPGQIVHLPDPRFMLHV